MQQQTKILKGLKNCYCDFVGTACGNDYNSNGEICESDLMNICRQVVQKNVQSGVLSLFLKSPNLEVARSVIEEFEIDGKVIISADKLQEIRVQDLLGDNVIVEVSSVLEMSDGALSNLSDLSAKMKVPLLFHLGRTLEEVGLISVRYHQSPSRFLEEFGFLDRECYILGGNYLDKDDFSLLSSYGAKVILTPKSDSLCGREFVNLLTLENADIDYCFGSDIYPIVNIFHEALLAYEGTANLLVNNFTLDLKRLEKSLQSDFGQVEIEDDDIDFPLGLFETERGQIVRVMSKDNKLIYQKGEKK